MEILRFKYKNWKGNVSVREVIAPQIVYTQSDYHGDEEQWFIKAVDVGKGGERLFSMRDIVEVY